MKMLKIMPKGPKNKKKKIKISQRSYPQAKPQYWYLSSDLSTLSTET